MTDNVFVNDNNQQQPPVTPEPQSNPFADQLGAIKNENGEPKYKTVEDALGALQHSQQFIETLKAEKSDTERKNLELENELNTRKSVEQVVQDLTKPTSQPQTPNTDPDGEDKGLNEDKVKEMIEQMMQNANQASVREQNVSSVTKTLSETFGDKTREVVVARAQELNMQPSQLENLAGENPALVLSLFKEVKIDSTTPTKSSIAPVQPNKDDNPFPTTENKLITGGASQAEVLEAWADVKEYTYKDLGVET